MEWEKLYLWNVKNHVYGIWEAVYVECEKLMWVQEDYLITTILRQGGNCEHDMITIAVSQENSWDSNIILSFLDPWCFVIYLSYCGHDNIS